MIPESVRQKLRYVRVSDPGVNLDRFPDFLIVGPQRTGTTWLHANLRFHPQIMLSEPKEIFYFSRLKTPDSVKFESDELTWYLKFFREPIWLRLAKTGICLWRYRELYRPLVRGEATASYAALDPEIIAEIAALNPNLKVILMIRDPVERAWSHAKKDLVRNRGRKFDEVSADEFFAFFNDGYQRQCARYVQCCDNWNAALQPGNFFVGFFDDIATRPEAMLLDVMSFLGVRSAPRYIPADVRQSVNPTAASGVPQRYREYLENLLHEDIVEVRRRFGPDDSAHQSN